MASHSPAKILMAFFDKRPAGPIYNGAGEQVGEVQNSGALDFSRELKDLSPEEKLELSNLALARLIEQNNPAYKDGDTVQMSPVA